MEESPYPGNINTVCGQIIHKAQLELVIVNGRGKVAIEDLEAVVGGHVKGVLDSLNGDLAFGHSVD